MSAAMVMLMNPYDNDEQIARKLVMQLKWHDNIQSSLVEDTDLHIERERVKTNQFIEKGAKDDGPISASERVSNQSTKERH